MNWKLIFTLSLFAIPMALAGVYGLPSNIEPIVWMVIFAAFAVVIARRASGKFFLHGWMVSVVNGVWIGSIHAVLFPTYIANNPQMAEQYQNMPHFASQPVMMVIMGPIFGAIFGIIAGLFAMIAGKVMKKK